MKGFIRRELNASFVYILDTDEIRRFYHEFIYTIPNIIISTLCYDTIK